MDARAFPTATAAALIAFRSGLHREMYGRWSGTLWRPTATALLQQHH